jgi:uncharacterized protein YqjF (DUF2071 family)
MSSTSPSHRLRIFRAATRNRVVVGYTVPPNQIAPHLPEGLVPDRQNETTYVSLVGVELVGGRVLGIRGPGVQRVPAVELCVHVQRAQASSTERGTWTVRAYVPRRIVAWAARGLYGEAVEVASMQPVWREQAGEVEATYRFDWSGREQRVRVRGVEPPVMPVPGAPAHTLTEPSWRYGTAGDGSLLRARVERSSTPVYRVQEYHLTVQWSAVYGDIGRLLQDRDPALVLLSPGAPIALQWRQRV